MKVLLRFIQYHKLQQPLLVLKLISCTSPSAIIDFEDQDLLAAAYTENRNQDDHGANEAVRIINDQMIFNQNIFITHSDVHSATNCNYYIELEQVKLSDNESTMATLQSIRSRYESYTPAGPT